MRCATTRHDSGYQWCTVGGGGEVTSKRQRETNESGEDERTQPVERNSVGFERIYYRKSTPLYTTRRRPALTAEITFVVHSVSREHVEYYPRFVDSPRLIKNRVFIREYFQIIN